MANVCLCLCKLCGERTRARVHKTLRAELTRVHAIHFLPPCQRVRHQLLLINELLPRSLTLRFASQADGAFEGLAPCKVDASDRGLAEVACKGDDHEPLISCRGRVVVDQLIHDTRAPVVRRGPALQIELEARDVNRDRDHAKLV